MQEEEVWKDIKGYEGIYQVSSLGRVKSLARRNSRGYSILDKTLKPRLNGQGYFQVSLWVNGKGSSILIHRLVAEAFVSNPESKPEVNHKDGVKTYNEKINLEWATSKENKLHADEVLGKDHRGEKQGSSKLTENDIHKIRGSTLLQRELAKMFKVSQANISDIKNYKIWNHI